MFVINDDYINIIILIKISKTLPMFSYTKIKE